MSTGGSCIAAALLGAFHGVNPAMGWLFAVALGLQERRRAAVLRALPPIALGHTASVAIVLAAVAGARTLVPLRPLQWTAGLVLLGFAFLRLRRRSHPRWVGMRVGFKDLTLWSFLMASAHGAGLMLVPLVLRGPVQPMPSMSGGAHAVMEHAALVATAPATTLLAVHTLALFGVMTIVALIVYEVLGVEMLRRAWVNLDTIWVGALFVAGGVTLLAA